mgnify:CR=1 FL=1
MSHPKAKDLNEMVSESHCNCLANSLISNAVRRAALLTKAKSEGSIPRQAAQAAGMLMSPKRKQQLPHPIAFLREIRPPLQLQIEDTMGGGGGGVPPAASGHSYMPPSTVKHA